MKLSEETTGAPRSLCRRLDCFKLAVLSPCVIPWLAVAKFKLLLLKIIAFFFFTFSLFRVLTIWLGRSCTKLPRIDLQHRCFGSFRQNRKKDACESRMPGIGDWGAEARCRGHAAMEDEWLVGYVSDYWLLHQNIDMLRQRSSIHDHGSDDSSNRWWWWW
ncbi:hypothetical protein U1Q18_001727 [Sarracenia purpurea var. burkii]